MSDEQFQAMLDIHTIVPFRVIRALAPTGARPRSRRRAEGEEVFRKIVNITSISGTMGNAGQANYSVRQGGRHRPDQDDREGVGTVQDQLSTPSPSASSRRGSTQAKEKGETMEAAGSGEEVALGIPEQMRQMATLTIPLGRPAAAVRRPRARCCSCAPSSRTSSTVR